jgi:hypothetical protein
MQYMLLIYEPDSAFQGEPGAQQLADIVARHIALSRELRGTGVLLAADGLQGVSSATTVRTRGASQTVQDGPFAETRERLGGYYLVDVPDLDAALAIARRIPVVDGGMVEVRPLMVH